MTGKSRLYDPRPHRALADDEIQDWIAYLTPQQQTVLAGLYQLLDEHEDEPGQMPFTRAMLAHLPALTASTFGKGREQFVEILRHHAQDPPSVEGTVQPADARTGEQEASKRGL